MTGLEKILEHIKSDADSEIEKVISQAKQEANSIIEEAKAQGSNKVKSIEEQTKVNYESLIKNGESAASLKEKRMILEAKQQVIEEMIRSAMESLEKLPDNEYFETIIKMVKKYALKNKEGKLLFSKSDLNRLPGNFKELLGEALKDNEVTMLTISNETRPINGGFVLLYGEIEENCSFEALFSAAKETLQDKVGALLFE